MVFSNISKVKNFKNTFVIGLLLGGGVLVLVTLRNILVLGPEGISNVYFPSHVVASLISIGPLLQRLEMNVILAFLACPFIKVSICVFAVCNGISKVFGFNDYKFIATLVALLMLTFSLFIYNNIMETTFFAKNVWQYYSFPFEVIIPLIVFILAEIKSRKSSAILATK